MSNEHKLLFQTDPRRFWEIVHDDDPDVRVAGFKSIDELLLCEVVRYGAYNREEMIGPLAKFYRGPIMQMTQEQRFVIFRHVARFVEHTSVVSPNAFLPFIAHDDDRKIVSTAVIDYVSLGPLTDGDPMSRVKDIIGMIESDALENEGAAFGALLHIGDKRVCDLLIPLRDSLDGEVTRNAIGCSTGFIHSATVEFYLDWLEGMDGTDQDGKFGLVAAGLGLLKKLNQFDQISTGHRPFPTRGVTPEQWSAMRKPSSLEQYIKRIAPRMYSLERTELPPRVMPHVLTAWGLEPHTNSAQMAALDDRVPSATARFGPEAIPGGRVVDVRSEWWDGEGQIYLTWGILNPNGPTLYVLGSREFDGRHRIFVRWLHMLGGSTTYAAETVSEITYQGIFDDAVSVREHLARNREDSLFHIIPSFVIANGGDETLVHIAKQLLASGEAAKGDWGRPMAYTRQFGSNFFGRAGAEIRAYTESALAEARSKGEEPSDFLKSIEWRYANIPDFRDAKIPTWTETSMMPELLEEWWRIVSPREFQVEALAALKTMWKGAPTVLSEEAKARAVPWDRVVQFLDAYGLSLAG